MPKTTKTEPATTEPAAPAVLAETVVVQELPPELLPKTPAPTRNEAFDVDVKGAIADRKYRLTPIHGTDERKRFRRTINAAVKLYGAELDRTKFLEHANGVYWTVYEGRKHERAAAVETSNG